MFEVESFGNLVNSLRSVRDDYHEHLKAVPQYDAFLLVETSTAKVTGTLQSLVGSTTTPSMAAEVIEALETARTKFKQHLTSVPEYRALLAIDKLITEVATDLGVKPETPVEAPSTVATVDEATVAPVTTSEAETLEAETPETVTLDVPETATQEAAVATETVEAQASEQEQAPEQEQTTSAVAQESDVAPQASDAAPVPTEADLLAQHAIARIEDALREEGHPTETATQNETESAVHASVEAAHEISTPHHETSDADGTTDAPEVEPHKYEEERAA